MPLPKELVKEQRVLQSTQCCLTSQGRRKLTERKVHDSHQSYVKWPSEMYSRAMRKLKLEIPTDRLSSVSRLEKLTFCKYLHFWFSMTVVYQVRTTYLFLPASCLLASVRAENTFKIRTVRKVLLNCWCTGICFTVYGGKTWPAFSEGTAWAKLAWQRSQGNELLSQPDCDKV